MYFLSSVFINQKKDNQSKDKGHIVFDTRQNTAACFTSCNFIQLKYSVNKEDIKFTSAPPEQEPCPETTAALEKDLRSILPKVTHYKCMGKDLILMNNKDTLAIFYEKDISKK